jgi:SWIM zinc finger
MKEIQLKVQGSADDPYLVSFHLSEKGVLVGAECNCKAGSMGNQCKHRISVLQGKCGAVVAGSDRIDEVRASLHGSAIEAALVTVRDVQARADKAKKELALAKKALAAALQGNLE